MNQPADPAAGPRVTRLDKRWWLFRMVPLAFFFGLFSLWGLYDATVAYPARGREVADTFLLDVLKMKFDQPLYRTAEVGTQDPKAEFARLREKAGTSPANEFDQARFRWLEALNYIGALDASQTQINDPLAKRQLLEAEAAKRPPNQKAKPLSPWDIPAQWMIFVGCGAVSVWMLGLLVVVRGRRYTWDPGRQCLGLPGGHSLTPADIQDFDKRKWHKFIVFANIKPGHTSLGGKSVKLDLYCHTDLESWILEMEKVVNPGAAADGAGTPSPAAPA